MLSTPRWSPCSEFRCCWKTTRGGMAGNLGGRSITHLGTPSTGSAAPGCIEGLVATWALPNRASRMPGFAASPLASASPLDYRAVFTLAADGDPLASRLRDEAIEAWAALTLNLIQSFDPARVILGGGIMASRDVILPALRDFVNRHAVLSSGPVASWPPRLVIMRRCSVASGFGMTRPSGSRLSAFRRSPGRFQTRQINSLKVARRADPEFRHG
jgi:hypothetical protein